MRTQRAFTLVLGLAVILSLVAALPVLVDRVRQELPNRRVELALDLDQADLLARSQGYRLDQVLTELQAAGLGAVAWSDTNLERLARDGDLAVYEGREILDRVAAGNPPEPELVAMAGEGFFNAGYTYALTRNAFMISWLEKNVPRQILPSRFRLVTRGGLSVFEIRLLKERAQFVNLGLWEGELTRSGAADLGLRVVVRPGNVVGGEAAVNAKLADLEATVERLGVRVSAVIFAGSEALGNPDALAATTAGLKRLGAPLALVETPEQLGNINQAGVGALAQSLDYKIVRVYSVPDVKVYAPSELADKSTRSVKERGLRLVYLQPYLVVPEHLAAAGASGVLTPGGWSVYAPPPSQTGDIDYTPILALNANYVAETAGQLAGQGYVIAKAVPLGGPEPRGALWAVVLGLGPAATTGLAWLALRPRGRLWILAGPVLAVGLAGFVALLALGGRGVLAAQMAALLAAISFPSLAMAYLAWSWVRSDARGRNVAGHIAADLGGAFGITLAGALLIGALLGDLRFMLEFQYFRGVKLTYVVPVAAALVYWVRYRHPDDTEPSAWPRVLANVAGLPIKIWHAAAALVLGGGFFYYVLRSGNTAGPPTGGLKLRLDRWLERVLYARPRLKEIIGYPALMAGSWLAHTGRKNLLGWFLIGASVSQVSLINSFEHIRTPLLLSLARVGNGLWVGALVGIAAIGVLWLLLRWAKGLEAWWARQGAVQEEGPR